MSAQIIAALRHRAQVLRLEAASLKGNRSAAENVPRELRIEIDERLADEFEALAISAEKPPAPGDHH